MAIRRTRCPRCQGIGWQSPWLPPAGIAPDLRSYECEDCKLVFYAVTGLNPLVIAKDVTGPPGNKQKSSQASF